MMTTNDKIIELFKEHFKASNFSQKCTASSFSCPYLEECKVDIRKEPSWTPALGDDSTKIMVVAEAPSAKGGPGPHIGGYVKDWTNEESVNALFRFIGNCFHTVPHFTDLMKCGLRRQTKEKKGEMFKSRIRNCIEQFLLKEISIINPESILCVGKTSFDALEREQEEGRINRSIKLFYLIHYGKQANLPLDNIDKEEIVWPYQVNKLPREKIMELSFFKKSTE
jgi:uracil-DNA glycosylase